MKEANTNSKFAQLMPEYIPGVRDDEKSALEVMAKAKAEFEQRKGQYEELASRHKFFVDEAALRTGESKTVNMKIRATLRDPSEFSHKNLITLRAEMRETLEMAENYLALGDELSGPLGEAKIQAGKAAHKYRSARAVAIEMIADNMLDAAIGAANSLFLAMYTKVTAYQERRLGERPWFEKGFDSEEAAVIADVNARITRLYRTLDDYYLRQVLPPPFGTPLELGCFGEWSPASCHNERVAAKARLDTSKT